MIQDVTESHRASNLSVQGRDTLGRYVCRALRLLSPHGGCVDSI